MSEPVDDKTEFERAYRLSLARERARADANDPASGRLFATYVAAGALGLGLVGLLIGPGDLWDSARLLSAGLFALGGALGGWRFWIIRDRD